MEHLHKVYDMLDRELEGLASQSPELTNGTLDQIDELTHAMKSLKTIIAMHESEQGRSGTGPYYWEDGGSYAKGGRSYDDGRRDWNRGYSGNRGGRMMR